MGGRTFRKSQGTELGPWQFILMINDLDIRDVSKWKFFDDTTAAEVVSKGAYNLVQDAVTDVEEWSTTLRNVKN
jgi:hypothetical protein